MDARTRRPRLLVSLAMACVCIAACDGERAAPQAPPGNNPPSPRGADVASTHKPKSDVQENSGGPVRQEKNDKPLPGDYGSELRWRYYLGQLANVRAGMTREEVLAIFGPSSQARYCPGHILQYVLFYENEKFFSEDDSKIIWIVFDETGHVLRVERSKWMYGPPPVQVIPPPAPPE